MTHKSKYQGALRFTVERQRSDGTFEIVYRTDDRERAEARVRKIRNSDSDFTAVIVEHYTPCRFCGTRVESFGQVCDDCELPDDPDREVSGDAYSRRGEE